MSTTLRLGDAIPNFEADTTAGKIQFHDWKGDSWVLLISHPNVYTPVCTTEMRRLLKLLPEFERRNVKIIGHSCNSVQNYLGWTKDIAQNESCATGKEFPFPLIGDEGRDVAISLGMIDESKKDDTAIPRNYRASYVIGPDNTLKYFSLYPGCTGRNFREIVRVIDSLQLLAVNKSVATPVDWEPGQKVMLLPSVKEEDAKKLFPKLEIESMPSGKGYMRATLEYAPSAAAGTKL